MTKDTNYMIRNELTLIKTDGNVNKVVENAEEAVRIQKNFWKWKNNQENLGGAK